MMEKKMKNRWILTITTAVLVSIFSLSCEKGSKSVTQIGGNAAADSTFLAAERQVVKFNSDWKFAKGGQQGAEAVDFNDSGWKAVRLPHDWAITGPFNPSEDGYAGKLPWRGQGWYRKTFKLESGDAGKCVFFDFDGVMAFPKVYVNGQLAGGWDYGYISFRVDATPYVKYGADNVIAVYVDTRNHGTRWYPGAGIYRKVMMTVAEPVHIAHWGTYITTPEITDKSAKVNVRTTVENRLNKEAKATVSSLLIDPEGKPVANSKAKIVTIPQNSSFDVEQSFVIANPQRWDITSPKLYTAKTVIWHGDEILDTDRTTFGVREFKFTADDGFYLNGRRVQLYGVCLHHDQGALGAAFNTRAMERQLEIMRDMGVNAIRTSHNPPAPELLELCDKMGFVVWDECFDKWNKTADIFEPNKTPLEQYGEKQIRNFVMRDRNHPSIVVWSIGNEIESPPQDPQGLTKERVQFMCDFVRKYDLTRPVGMACCFPYQVAKGVFDALDLAGWNYQRRYTQYRQKYPDKPIIYSESASTVSTRGFYELPLAGAKTQFSKTFQVSSYDRNAPDWADISDRDLALMEKDKFVAGEFVWTGFDYLGEPTPYSKQARSSYFGIVDLAGIPKDRYYLYRSHWRPNALTIHILPHWNWPDRIGQNVPVYVYTNGDTVELFLNGKSLGRQTKAKEAGTGYYGAIDKYRLCFNDVNYEPGELRAVAYKDGKEIGQEVMRTAGEPAKIRLIPDRREILATGEDLSYILVEAVDSNSVPCPLADNLIKFKIDGPGEIAGIDNGNPLSLEPFQNAEHKLFYGKAMLILRSKEQGGNIRIMADSDGLQPGGVLVESR
jgi:beta-galactosidase